MCSKKFTAKIDLSACTGRVFAVGDVHGQFPKLENALISSKISTNDVVIFVGDLINRGFGSLSVLEALAENPNYITVLGNHEYKFLQFYRKYLHGVKNYMGLTAIAAEHKDLKSFTDRYAYWLYDMSSLDWMNLHDIIPILEEFPYLLDLTMPDGKRVIVTHGAMPAGSPDAVIRRMTSKKNRISSRYLEFVTCDRRLPRLADCQEIRSTYQAMEIPHCGMMNVDSVVRYSGLDHDPEAMIPDVDLVVHGHTILPAPTLIGNHLYLDTGAFLPAGSLSIIDLAKVTFDVDRN